MQSVLPTLAAAGTTCRFVRHNRVDRLDELVRALAERHRRVWYLADGVYSMHGDQAPLAGCASWSRGTSSCRCTSTTRTA